MKKRDEVMDDGAKQKIKLIVTDLDGTLLGPDGKVPARSAEAVARARAAGIGTAISTGRMYPSAMHFADALGTTAPIVCYNGAMVRTVDGRVIMHDPLDLAIATRCLEYCRSRGIYVQSYIDDVLYVCSMEADQADFYTKHYGIQGVPIGDDLFSPKSSPTKLLAMTSGIDETHSVIDEISRELDGKVYVTSSDPIFVEMMDPKVNKARAVKIMCESLGLTLDEILAIGDGENDAGMIASAGIGVAMGNARAAAKEAADVIVATNAECGFAQAIDMILEAR